ncbi:hypothetical protein M8818_005461 [Zalaria obscura]|uniref:Uncharacterized protein n=1 Tax=Zalaria obscura TaxID=2024903 RepID=A0ACC3S802_9PEZI
MAPYGPFARVAMSDDRIPGFWRFDEGVGSQAELRERCATTRAARQASTSIREPGDSALLCFGCPVHCPCGVGLDGRALGSGILFTYPEISTIAGVQGLVVYALSSSLPLLIFGALGPIIRRKCPEGFVLTEWTRQRYGILASIYLSIMTCVHRPLNTFCHRQANPLTPHPA